MPDRDREADLDRPVSLWKELDRIRGFQEQTTVVIFRTRGCSWFNFSSCSMCGYFNDVSSRIETENLFRQIDLMSSSLADSRVLKVFTSGSFLDPMEIPLEARDYFYESIANKVDEVLVESRTEYMTQRNIGPLRNYEVPSRIAIGLESADDNLMKQSINKGSTFSKFMDAAQVIKGLGLELRTYLLFKPPFISEKAAIRDILRSIKKVAGVSDDVSVNPMNIQKNTMVEKLWKAGLYRPPRLWSLARILLESRNSGTSIVSYPTGGDKVRGVHNEEKDRTLLNLIFKASLSQDFSELEEYYNSADRTAYDRRIEVEDTQLFQPDYSRLAGRISGSSAYL